MADPGNSDFPPCPVTVEDGQGYPQFGTYRGSLPEVDLTRLRGPYELPPPRRWFKHKRWQYGMVSTPNVLAVFSVADLTYIANAFACAVDLTAKKLLFDRGWMGVPGPWISVGNRPGLNARARFLMPGVRFAFGPIEQARQYRVEVESYGKPWAKPVFALKVQLVSPPEPSPLTVIAPVLGDGIVNVTEKWAGLPASGRVTADAQTFSMEGAVLGFDYTQGYLARRTVWRWAFANGRLSDGRTIGFNIAKGINEGAEQNENAVWIGSRLIPLGPAQFTFNPSNPMDEWRVETKQLRLRFQPIHAHREERDYKLVKSHFVQPLGLFEGELRLADEVIQIERLAGVTEDQNILW